MFKIEDLKVEGHTNQEIPQPKPSDANGLYPTVLCLVYGNLDTGFGYGIREWSVLDESFSTDDGDDYGFDLKDVERWWYWEDILNILN